ncbi:MAG: sigma-54 interaction domain-containing protein [Chitinispirillaceae bacterium]
MSCFDTTGTLSEHCYETILQTMAEGVFIVDTNGIIRFCNQALEILSGYAAHELIGRDCRHIMMCSCSSMEECSLFSEKSLNNAECRIRRKNGTTVPVLKNGRVMYDDAGEARGAVETVTDISVLKKAEYRLAELEGEMKGKSSFHGIIGHSRPMREVFELIDLAAASNATLLVNGETGTGKEMVAQAIHDRSSRKDAPLVKINCSALPESLLESELFGHVRGAFTGAVKDKIGRFEMADGGTLFLDEIGEISPLLQVKLLRFLQEREFERVGESITRRSDVRIIAATNKDLRRMVMRGEFREDLYYRLKVFPIHLPPLRERKEDIGPLVRHFIGKFNEETGKKLTGLSHEAAITLMDYCWPGNVRELENAIEHAFVTCQEGSIDLFDLPLEIRRVELRADFCRPEDDRKLRDAQVPFVSQPVRRELGKDELISLLEQLNWNKTEVARKLGVDRTTVWRKMKRMGIRG